MNKKFFQSKFDGAKAVARTVKPAPILGAIVMTVFVVTMISGHVLVAFGILAGALLLAVVCGM